MPDSQMHYCSRCGDVEVPKWSESRDYIEGYLCIRCGVTEDAPARPTSAFSRASRAVRGPRQGDAKKAPQRAAQPVLPGVRTRTAKPKADAPEPRRTGSRLEALLAEQLEVRGVQGLVREYRFAAPRMFRADFAIPAIRLLIEVEGGTYGVSRHTSPAGYRKDCEKYRAASLGGWVLLRYVSKDVTTGIAAKEIAEVVECLNRKARGGQ